VLSYVNRVSDVLNAIVTGELLFQRVPFLRTLARDAPYWIRMFWTAQVKAGAKPAPGLRTATKLRYNDPASYGHELGAFYREVTGAAPVGSEEYLEFRCDGLRLAISSQRAMNLFGAAATTPAENRSLLLEFQVEDVDRERARLEHQAE